MAVRSLLHYAFEVPDPTVGETFYSSFGLVDAPGRDDAEYFHDLDYVPEQCAWEPRDFPEADARYRWGPTVPDDFGFNREVGD